MGAIGALQGFMDAWRENDWAKMMMHCQLTWMSIQKDARRTLALSFGAATLLSYTVEKTHEISPVCVDFVVRLVVETDKGKATYEKTAKVICEVKPYKTSVDGYWGMNPFTIFGR